MPRRRPRSGARPQGRAPGRADAVEEASDGDWVVRAITGSATAKAFRCPGCDQEIRAATPHVVSWPAYVRDSDLAPWDTESGVDLRRHWHTPCWRARGRRH